MAGVAADPSVLGFHACCRFCEQCVTVMVGGVWCGPCALQLERSGMSANRRACNALSCCPGQSVCGVCMGNTASAAEAVGAEWPVVH